MQSCYSFFSDLTSIPFFFHKGEPQSFSSTVMPTKIHSILWYPDSPAYPSDQCHFAAFVFVPICFLFPHVYTEHGPDQGLCLCPAFKQCIELKKILWLMITAPRDNGNINKLSNVNNLCHFILETEQYPKIINYLCIISGDIYRDKDAEC